MGMSHKVRPFPVMVSAFSSVYSFALICYDFMIWDVLASQCLCLLSGCVCVLISLSLAIGVF